MNLSLLPLTEKIKKCDLCGSKEFVYKKTKKAVEWDFVKKYYADEKENSVLTKIPGEFILNSCKDCGLVFVNPRIKDKYLNIFYNEYLSGKYNNYIHNYDGAFRKNEFQKTFSLLNPYLKSVNKNHLDIGCATGELLDISGNNGFNPFGIEISELAGKKARSYGSVYIGDVIFQLNRIKKEFGLVTMIDSIEHLKSPRSVLTLLRNKLSNNGLIYIETPNSEAGFDEMSRHYYLYSKETLMRLLNGLGYEVLLLDATDIKYNKCDKIRKERFIRAIARV